MSAVLQKPLVQPAEVPEISAEALKLARAQLEAVEALARARSAYHDAMARFRRLRHLHAEQIRLAEARVRELGAEHLVRGARS